jgi:hypothetical protein
MMRIWFMYIDGNVINDHASLCLFHGNCDIPAVACLVVPAS